MSFIKRWFGRKTNVQVLKDKRDLLALDDALDVDEIRQEAADALIGFGSEAVQTLLDSANKHYQLIVNSIQRGDRIKAGWLMNSLRFRIEVLGRIGVIQAIPIMMYALANAAMMADVPEEITEATKRVDMEEIMRFADPDYQPDRFREMKKAEERQRLFQPVLQARLLLEATGEALQAIGVPAIQPLIKSLGDNRYPVTIPSPI